MAAKNPAEPAAETAPAKKKSKLLLIVIVLVVVLAAAGGAAWFLLRGKPAPAVAAAPKPAPQLFMALDPPLVVNFQDQGQLRFLQVGIELMAHDQKALDAVKQESPVIRNALLMLLSGQDAKTLLTRAGKEKLRADALAEIQKILHQRDPKQNIAALYFTSFVMQ